jgi:cytosine/creatinine deaminase
MVLLPCASGVAAVAEISRPVWGMKAGRMTFEAPRPRLCRPASATPQAAFAQADTGR